MNWDFLYLYGIVAYAVLATCVYCARLSRPTRPAGRDATLSVDPGDEAESPVRDSGAAREIVRDVSEVPIVDKDNYEPPPYSQLTT